LAGWFLAEKPQVTLLPARRLEAQNPPMSRRVSDGGEGSSRSLRISWIAWGLAVALMVAAVTLSFLNHTFQRDPFTYLSIGVVFAYATVGAILVAKLPHNPIAWLFLAIGGSLLLGGFSTEYATYTFATSPGTLPFGSAAAWVNSWSFVGATVVPLLLLIFPTGRVPSPKWRWAPWVLIACSGMLVLAAMFRPGPLDVAADVTPQNPLGIEALHGALTLVVWVSGLGLIAMTALSVVALVQRFHRSRGEERQQLRWLAYVGAIGGVTLAAALLSSIGLKTGESSTVNDVSFLLFFLDLGIGVPAATLVALLKYRLFELDIVLRKTVAFTIVAAFITALYLIALALATFTSLGAIGGGVVFVLTFSLVRRRARSLANRLVYGKRATPFEVLSEFSENLGGTYSIDDVLPRMTQLLAAGTGATHASVWLRKERTLSAVASWPPEVSAEPDRHMVGEDLPGFDEGLLTYPVTHQGELLGAITLRMLANDPMDAAKERLVTGVASQAGLALRNVRLVEDLRASRRRIVTAQDERAKRLERNIHDGAQQQLVALAVKLRLANTVVDRDVGKAHELLDQLQGEANDALENLRDLARGIYPPLLADKGLTAALEAQVRKSAVPAIVEADGIGRFTAEVEAAVYFSCLEALTNAAKYSQASSTRVRLANGAGELRFEVTDDGQGFDVASTPRGSGLQGITDRLAALGGTVVVTSTPGAGTTIAGVLPT
jgi:signal transduction histidine kinase